MADRVMIKIEELKNPQLVVEYFNEEVYQDNLEYGTRELIGVDSYVKVTFPSGKVVSFIVVNSIDCSFISYSADVNPHITEEFEMVGVEYTII